MRLALLLLLGLFASQDPGQDWLRRILDRPAGSGVPALEKLLEAEPEAGVRALDALVEKLRTDRGRSRWAALLRRRRADPRSLTALDGLDPRSLWALGLGQDEKGRRLVFIDARVFRDAEVPFGAPRRQRIEYLLCQDPPEEGVVSQSYESLAGASESELGLLLKLHKPGQKLVLRWFENGALRQETVGKLVPGAKPRPSHGSLRLDERDRDLRALKGLPPDGRALQVGLVPGS